MMYETISSLQNARIKRVIQLRDAGHRKALGLTLIDGLRELQYGLQASLSVDSVFATPSVLQELAAQDWFSNIPKDRVVIVTENVFRRIGYGERNSGLVAVVQLPHLALNQFQPAPDALLLVLDRVEKPGNLGAILRTADATGVSMVVLTDPVCEAYNPNAIRASMGAIFCIPIVTTSPGELFAWAGHHAVQLLTTRVDGSRLYSDFDFRRATAIVLGSEAQGLGQQWNIPGVAAARLPMMGRVDSLNVSVAAGVVLYEAVRQRRSEDRLGSD